MPGKGHRQTDGYVDRGPKLFYKPPKHTRPYAWTTFDQVSSAIGLRAWARDTGFESSGDRRRPTKKDPDQGAKNPYGQPGSARRHYTETLRAFFGTRLSLITSKDRLHIDSIMAGESLRESADELDVSHVAILKGRRRALDNLAKSIGNTPADLANELVFFFQSEGGVALAGRLPDRVLALSTKWRGQ